MRGQRGFKESFYDAFRGLWEALKTQRNLRVHFGAAFLAVSLGLWLNLSPLEWGLLTLTVALVLTAELLNSALEDAVDLASPDLHPLAQRAKDVAAAAVLVTALAAVLMGLLLFLPKLLAHLI